MPKQNCTPGHSVLMFWVSYDSSPNLYVLSYDSQVSGRALRSGVPTIFRTPGLKLSVRPCEGRSIFGRANVRFRVLRFESGFSFGTNWKSLQKRFEPHSPVGARRATADPLETPGRGVSAECCRCTAAGTRNTYKPPSTLHRARFSERWDHAHRVTWK